MSDFWEGTWGKLIRRAGIYAAGAIPFVGIAAQYLVAWADQETFGDGKKKPTTTARPASTASGPIKPTPVSTVPHDSLFTGAGTGGLPDNSQAEGLDSFVANPQLPGPVDISPDTKSPGLSIPVAVTALFLTIMIVAIIATYLRRK